MIVNSHRLLLASLHQVPERSFLSPFQFLEMVVQPTQLLVQPLTFNLQITSLLCDLEFLRVQRKDAARVFRGVVAQEGYGVLVGEGVDAAREAGERGGGGGEAEVSSSMKY